MLVKFACINYLVSVRVCVCACAGTVAWAERLQWQMADFWVKQAIRTPLDVDGIVEGFVKSAGNFYFYWINRAGHMVSLCAFAPV